MYLDKTVCTWGATADRLLDGSAAVLKGVGDTEAPPIPEAEEAAATALVDRKDGADGVTSLLAPESPGESVQNKIVKIILSAGFEKNTIISNFDSKSSN